MPGGKKDGNCCQKFQDGVFGNMEKGFQKFGTLVGGSPYITILIGLLVSGLFMIGLIQFRDEEKMVELWVPDESEFYNNYKWVKEHFHSTERLQHYLLVSRNNKNVLTRDNLELMLTISKNMSSEIRRYELSFACVTVGVGYKTTIFFL